MNLIRTFIIVGTFLFSIGFLNAQEVSLLTWNIQDLGRTKSDQELAMMASIMKEFDIVAIQEVVAKDPAGGKAVAKIADLLNRSGSKWDYSVSDPTTGTSHEKERYAFIWKTAAVNIIGRPWLEKSLAQVVNREPYMARFNVGGESVLIANYHSIPNSKKPQWENEQVLRIPLMYDTDKILIAGDYNINSSDKFWNKLNHYELTLAPHNQKSTLRRGCNSNNNFTYTNHAIDFFIYEDSEINVVKSNVVDFIGECGNLELGRSLSDHLPVYCVFNFN